MDTLTRVLIGQHRDLAAKATTLAGVAAGLRLESEAELANWLIADLNRLLAAHLETEDRLVYGVLMADADPDLSGTAAAAFADVGGLMEAWTQFRQRWTVEAMLAEPARFATAAQSVAGALATRIQLEEEVLYPAAAGRSHPITMVAA